MLEHVVYVKFKPLDYLEYNKYFDYTICKGGLTMKAVLNVFLL